jgi:hypothetical protein
MKARRNPPRLIKVGSARTVKNSEDNMDRSAPDRQMMQVSFTLIIVGLVLGIVGWFRFLMGPLQ